MSDPMAPSSTAPAGSAQPTDRRRIELEIRARYADELARADICDGLRIEMRIRADVEEALARCDLPVA